MSSVSYLARPTPLLVSRSLALVTLLLSDVSGPRTRQRFVVGDASLPSWLPPFTSSEGQETVIATMGRAPSGSRTRIRSIVLYPAQNGRLDFAYVYVEEHRSAGRGQRDASPIHVVRCPPLPESVRFVELKAGIEAGEGPSLRLI